MFIAVRTGLEPATPCVTGMYSNQAELPFHCFVAISLDCGCKGRHFFYTCNSIWKFFEGVKA